MATATMDGGGPALVTQCLEFSKALASMGQSVSLSINIGSFSFSLDTRGKRKISSPEKVKKKPSPSTLRRNQRRKVEFQKKKLEEQNKSGTVNDMEATNQDGKTFECEQCEKIFNTEGGLKIHIGRSHKVPKPLPSSEKIREDKQETSLCVSPDKDTDRVEVEEEEEEDEDQTEDDDEVKSVQRLRLDPGPGRWCCMRYPHCLC